MCDGERAFVLFDADGTVLMVVTAVEIAMEMAAERGLKLVAAHSAEWTAMSVITT
jgi:hypothetical protein